MIRSHDRGFVAAPPAAVDAAVADPSTYARWWPGARMAGATPVLPLARGGVPARPHGRREGLGLHLELERPSGGLEWFLEAFDDGTLVNVFLHLEDVPDSPRGRRRLLGMRGEIRRGLVGMKRRLERGGVPS